MIAWEINDITQCVNYMLYGLRVFVEEMQCQSVGESQPNPRGKEW